MGPKKEVAMNAGSNKILSARLGENIIITSSPGERSVHGLHGLDLFSGQYISHTHTLNNCHDRTTNHKEKYPNTNIVDQLQRSTISVTTNPRHIFKGWIPFLLKTSTFPQSTWSQNQRVCTEINMNSLH